MEVLVGLRDLKTKMDFLVGPDMTNGEWSRVKETVIRHDQWIEQQKGAARGGSKWSTRLWSAVIAFVAATIGAIANGIWRK